MNHDDNLRIGQGEVLRAKLEAATDEDVREEYEYRVLRNLKGHAYGMDVNAERVEQIDAIVQAVDRTGDGPESLKDMLRFR